MDTAASTVTVRVHLANRGAADYLGEDLTVAVASDARILKAVGRRNARISRSDLVVGEKLRVQGKIDYASGSTTFIGKRLVMRRLRHQRDQALRLPRSRHGGGRRRPGR